ncbi:hypothetical protein CBF34_07275 [Vagococcus penaei]|uniref:Uncharacterized protein n=1 Tax=Vagococcus penaei TaxID=633807 RepID=A0A1Q2D3H9_9ENTE|nr:FtsX-like permease family protein [Vagococcus penaei]AQP52916.1 hypothetical protein BW732_00865 [Vagococcus penaei]RSU01450.1 hypothetical protein CBF34_07275 [Vagococcus penaei]
MTSIKQYYLSLKYHKKLAIVFFLIFTCLLFLFVLLYQLRVTQLNSHELIQEKWNYFTGLSVDTKANVQEALLENNFSLLTFYNHLLFGLILLSFMIIYLFGYISSKKRRPEINYMLNNGVKTFEIIARFMIDALIAAICSLLILTLVLSILQNTFIKSTVYLNQCVSTKELSKRNLVIEHAPDLKSLARPETTEIPKNPENNLLPFNENSMFSSHLEKHTITEIIRNVNQHFVLLLIISAWSLFLGNYSYMLIHVKNRRIE